MSNIGIGVNFTGTENVNRTISSIKSGLNGLEREAKDVGDTSSGAFAKAKSGMEDLGRAVENTGGSFTVLKGATSVFLGELATKITGLAIKAVKMLARELVELGKEMIKLGLESNAGAKGMFDNFNTEITKLKTLFGVELVSVIGPALQGVADNISRLTAQGSFEPLVASFGSLASKVLELLGSTWGLVKAMMNVSDDEEAIAKIADAFDRVGYFVSALNELLERTQTLISSLNLDKVGQIYNFLSAGTPGGALWGYAGQQVANSNMGGRNQPRFGAPSKDAKEVEKSTKATEDQTKSTQRATFTVDGYSSSVGSAADATNVLESAAGAAADALGSIFGFKSGGGSGGSGGCRTFGTKITVDAAGNEPLSNDVPNVGGRFDLSTATSQIYAPDALVTKKGDVVRFNPNDNILAYQNPSALRGSLGGGGANITINVNGAGDPERVAELILKKINTKVGMAW